MIPKRDRLKLELQVDFNTVNNIYVLHTSKRANTRSVNVMSLFYTYGDRRRSVPLSNLDPPCYYLEIVLRRAASIVRVFTIYRPPSSGRKSTPSRPEVYAIPAGSLRHPGRKSTPSRPEVYAIPAGSLRHPGRKSTPPRLFSDEFSRVLGRAATQQTECVILGDFNVHYGDDRACDDRAGDDHAGDDRAGDDRAGDDRACDDRAGDDRACDDRAGDDRAGDARDLADLLRETDFQQHVTEPTHVGGYILDLEITRNMHNCIVSAVSVHRPSCDPVRPSHGQISTGNTLQLTTLSLSQT